MPSKLLSLNAVNHVSIMSRVESHYIKILKKLIHKSKRNNINPNVISEYDNAYG